MAHWGKKLRCLIAGLSALAGSALSIGQATAADGALTELYGYGVHRYYAGDYQEAQRVLNIVIEAGVEDPRPHYFRGLVTYQMGMQDAAKADFEHAADLEARGKGTSSIGWALQRIQGPVRQEIEMARLMARVAVTQEQRAQKEAAAAQSQTTPNVAKPPVASPDSLPPAISNQPPAAEPAVPPAPSDTPFGDTPATPPTTPDAQVNPFQDDAQVPAPAEPPAGETPNPFQ